MVSPPTTTRLSLLINRTFPLALDRSRLATADPPLPVPPSLSSQINTNAAHIVNGILELERDPLHQDTTSFREGWARLRTMLGEDWDGVELPPPKADVAEEDNALANSENGFPVPSLSNNAGRRERDLAVPFRDSPPPSPTFSPHTELQMQSHIIGAQDEQLDHLSRSLRTQHEIGLQIGSELDVHTGLLEELDHDVDHTESRLSRARRSLDKVARGARNNASAWSIGLLIFVLLILIIVFKT